jgi:hypothetical protein
VQEKIRYLEVFVNTSRERERERERVIERERERERIPLSACVHTSRVLGSTPLIVSEAML